MVGKLARDLYAEGTAVPFGTVPNENAAMRTAALLSGDAPAIFEATFIEDKYLARVDILEKDANGWNLIEVKSMSDYDARKHLGDIGYQVYVLRKCGLPVRGAALLHLDKAYAWVEDEYALDRLFTRRDLLTEVEAALPDIEARAASFNTLWELSDSPLLDGIPPHVDPDLGGNCRQCGYSEHCFGEAPANHIFYLGLHHTRVKKLRQAGVRTIDRIPANFEVNSTEALKLRAHVSGSPAVSDDLADRLAAIEYPAFCLDFETMRPALPMLPGTHPYELLPFQWSCHRLDGPPDAGVISKGSGTGHTEFLHREPSDPREGFVRSLLSLLDTGGSVLHYSPYERTVVKAMAEAGVPGAAELQALVSPRFLDLEEIIKGCYADAGFKGRTSIKAVLPVLCPDLSYDTLTIRGGDAAMAEYERTFSAECTNAERDAIFCGLLEYCRLDTWAMVRVLAALYEAGGLRKPPVETTRS